jgi:hypothetical protein
VPCRAEKKSTPSCAAARCSGVSTAPSSTSSRRQLRRGSPPVTDVCPAPPPKGQTFPPSPPSTVPIRTPHLHTSPLLAPLPPRNQQLHPRLQSPRSRPIQTASLKAQQRFELPPSRSPPLSDALVGCCWASGRRCSVRRRPGTAPLPSPAGNFPIRLVLRRPGSYKIPFFFLVY